MFATRKKRPDLAVYFKANSKTTVRFFDSDGLSLSRDMEKEIITATEGRNLIVPTFKNYGKMVFIKGFKEEYLKDLVSSFGPFGGRISVKIKTADKNLNVFLEELLKKLKIPSGEDIIFMLIKGGRKALCYSEETGFVSFEKLIAIASLGAFIEGRDVALPVSAPSVIDIIASVYERRVWRYQDSPINGKDSLSREKAKEFLQFYDGLKLILSVLSFLNKTGLSLKNALKLLPPFEVTVKTAEISEEENLKKLLGNSSIKDFSDGFSFILGEGRVFLQPVAFTNEIKIYAEASSLEASRELGLYVENIISGKENLT